MRTQSSLIPVEGHGQDWFVATGAAWALVFTGTYSITQVLLSYAFPSQPIMVNYGPELLSILWSVPLYRYWGRPFNEWVKKEEARRKAGVRYQLIR